MEIKKLMQFQDSQTLNNLQQISKEDVENLSEALIFLFFDSLTMQSAVNKGEITTSN